MLKYNSIIINLLKRLGAVLSELRFNGLHIWPASRVSTFTFELPSSNPTVDLWLTQSSERAVTVTMDDGAVLRSNQLKAEYAYRFESGGTHTVTVEVEDGEIWIPGANFGSADHKAFTGQVITESDTNATLKTAVFGRGVDLSSADAFGAFSKCAGLTSVDFSGCDETTITWEVFGDCSSLTTVVWGNIQNIGNWAFHDCGFVELHIPSTIDTVAQQAFSSLSSLLRVEVAAKHVAPQAVAHCANLQYIWVRNSCLELQANAPDNQRYTTQWNKCSPTATFCCEPSSKPSAWGSLFNAYDYESGEYLRYTLYWSQTIAPWINPPTPDIPVMLDYNYNDGQLLFYEEDDRCHTCGGTGIEHDECMSCYGTGERDMECPTCVGTGYVDVFVTCPTCDGTGEYEGGICPTCQGTGGTDVQETCEECGGSGRIEEECPDCGGVGYTTQTCTECNGTGIGHYGEYDEYTFDAQSGELEIFQQEEEEGAP